MIYRTFDSSPATVPLPLRVEPKPKSGIRQQDLLKKVVEVKPKRPKVSCGSMTSAGQTKVIAVVNQEKDEQVVQKSDEEQLKTEEKTTGKPLKSLLGLAYDSSDDEED
uniref:Uncharacterized protein n=1 Tax=Kalanchoe fedtschenkoi TaxID=63787 RepID=A0A7N0V7A0_KALFE